MQDRVGSDGRRNLLKPGEAVEVTLLPKVVRISAFSTGLPAILVGGEMQSESRYLKQFVP
jgi:hypothetical protein